MKRCISINVLLLIFMSLPLLAQGDLVLLDLRAEFKGDSRKEIVKFMNPTSDTLRYSLRMTERRMSSDGGLLQVEYDSLAVDNFAAAPYLRVFPRSVVLAPNEMQSVVIQFRKSTDMKSGEYRSHLSFIPEAKFGELGLPQGLSNSNSAAVGVNIKARVGVSIPVRILIGDQQIEAEIKNLRLQKDQTGKATVNCDVYRSGNRSLSGSVYVEHLLPSGQIDTLANGQLAIYRELNMRSVQLNLEKTPVGGKLRIRCVQIDGEEETSLASQEIYL